MGSIGVPIEAEAVNHDVENGELPPAEDDDADGADAQLELSKRDKRRAREAAKRAKEQEAAAGAQVRITFVHTDQPLHSSSHLEM